MSDLDSRDDPMGDDPMDGGNSKEIAQKDTVDEQTVDEDAAGDGELEPETWVEAASVAALQQAFSQGERRIEALNILPEEHVQSLELLYDGLKAGRLDGLYFENCQVTDAELIKFAEVIPSTFEGLSVKKNASSASAVGFHALWAAMPPSLIKIDFGDNGLTDEDARPLFEKMSELTNLETVYLDGNQLSDIRPLVAALRKNEVLEQIDLGDNRIGDDGLDAFGELLANTPSLTQAILGSNPYSSAAATRFATKLPESNLAVLYMDSTAVDDAFLEASAKSFSGLEELHLDSTQISDEGLKHLLPCLANMEELDVSENPNVSEEMEAALRLSMGGSEICRPCD